MVFRLEKNTAGQIQRRIRAAARKRRLAHNITQKELADKSGVPLSTLKKFEQSGEISLTSILAIAEALGALEEFEELFPIPPATSLDQLGTDSNKRQRAGRRKS